MFSSSSVNRNLLAIYHVTLLLGSTLSTGSCRCGQTETKGTLWGLYGQDVRVKVCLIRHEVTAAVITFESGQNPSRKF